MNDKPGTFSEPGTIYFERLLPGSIERVWSYLTESEKRSKWLAAGKMELCVGGKVELNFKHENLSPHDNPIPEKYQNHEGGSTMHGTITKLDPPNLLAYTWREDSGSNSEVTFRLEEKGDGVLLTLTHRKLGDNSDILISVAAGWHTHLGILIDNLNGNTPKGFWTIHSKMEEAYEQQLATD